MNCSLVESVLTATGSAQMIEDSDYLQSTQEECTDSSDTDIDTSSEYTSVNGTNYFVFALHMEV